MARRHPGQIITSHGEGAHERAEEMGDHKTLAEIEEEIRALGVSSLNRRGNEKLTSTGSDLADYIHLFTHRSETLHTAQY